MAADSQGYSQKPPAKCLGCVKLDCGHVNQTTYYFCLDPSRSGDVSKPGECPGKVAKTGGR